jgi:WD40 repeat protein
VSPNRHLVALAYESLALASLPDLTLLPHLMTNTRQSGVHAGPARSIAFTPGGDGIVVGQFNGQVVYYEIKDSLRLIRKKLVTNHNQPVIGLQFIPNHPMLVSCTTVGLIRFTAWPSQENIGNGISTGLPITSLQISADGSFMAIGTRDARIILFDLRVRDLPSIFATPVAQVTPVQAAAITSLLEEKDLVPALQNSLSILMELIQQRFQFNIEIEEAPVIQRGEFDVIID